MSEITVFAYDSHAIRMIQGEDGEPWFVAADVCNALDIKNAADAIKRLDDDEKGVDSIYTLGGSQELAVVNEAGLYMLILSSRKPEAKIFKRWVAHEVIPSIRKTGRYESKPERSPEDPLPFDRLAPESLPFRQVHPSLYAELRRTSKALAQAYLIECGVTPDYVAAQLARIPGAAYQAPALGEPQTSVHLAERFYDDWENGALGVPFIPCLARQIRELFRVWKEDNAPDTHITEHMFSTAFNRTPGIRNRNDRWTDPRHKPPLSTKTAAVIIPDRQNPPPGQNRGIWLGDCIAEMDAAIRSIRA